MSETAASLAAVLAALTSGDDELAEAAAAALPAHGPLALAALSSLLDSSDPDVRWWALRALSGFPGLEPARRLVERLQNDPDDAARACAALGLRRLTDPAESPSPPESRLDVFAIAAPALIAALSDRDPLCADLAADALTAAGSASVPVLLEIFAQPSGQRSFERRARLRALRALAKIADPRAIPILMSAFQEDSALMEYWADHGLDKLGLGMVLLKP
jgi:HEAT repeat protein